MFEIYVPIAVFAGISAALAWLGARAFSALFGQDSPWRKEPRPLFVAPNLEKYAGLIAAFETAGIAISAGLLGWHLVVAPLPEPVLWYVAAPLAAFCIAGRMRAAFRRLRRRTQATSTDARLT